MKFSSIPAAHLVVSRCKDLGIRQVVISPGSRNAPLTLGFTSDPFFECFSIVDERSAGFFAMGLTQQSGIATALVCTSGSALLNYYPAIAEAFYSRIPLLILSADRPPYKIDIGDGQTIRQEGVYKNHIGYQTQLFQDATHATQKLHWLRDPENPKKLIDREKLPVGEGLMQLQQAIQTSNLQIITEAVDIARESHLPVHLNIPFEEPLYELATVPPADTSNFQLAHSEGFSKQKTQQVIDWETLRSRWASSSRIMILAGVMPPESVSPEIQNNLGSDKSILVLTETLSNLDSPEFFPSIDSIIAPMEIRGQAEDREKLKPDLLLTIGGMIVSKKIKQYLRKNPPAAHWHIDPFQANDTFYTHPNHIRLTPQVFFEKLLEHDKSSASVKSYGVKDSLKAAKSHGGVEDESYRSYWDKVKARYLGLREEYLKTIPFCDFKAFAMLCQELPESATIQLANSSTVRYAQLFDRKPGQRVFGNRGTSGIEGSTSTAVGASINAKEATICISGDLSFFYDINGLWNKYLPKDFKIIVVNNGGGGIFRILPGFREGDQFRQYFETAHTTDITAVCSLYGLEYSLATNEQELQNTLSAFLTKNDSPQLLEIKTPREVNNKILLAYFDFLS